MSGKTRKINRPQIRIECLAGGQAQPLSTQEAEGVRGGYLGYTLSDCMVSGFRALSPKVGGSGIVATDVCGPWPT